MLQYQMNESRFLSQGHHDVLGRWAWRQTQQSVESAINTPTLLFGSQEMLGTHLAVQRRLSDISANKQGPVSKSRKPRYSEEIAGSVLQACRGKSVSI